VCSHYSALFLSAPPPPGCCTLSLHDALPILGPRLPHRRPAGAPLAPLRPRHAPRRRAARLRLDPTAPAALPRRRGAPGVRGVGRSEEHTSELQSLAYLVCRLLLEKKKLTTLYRVVFQLHHTSEQSLRQHPTKTVSIHHLRVVQSPTDCHPIAQYLFQSLATPYHVF